MTIDRAHVACVLFSIPLAFAALGTASFAQVPLPGCVSELGSRGQDGAVGNNVSFGTGVSADGRSVIFMSDADNLVPGDTNFLRDVFVRDRWTATTRRVNVNSSGAEGHGGDSGNGALSPSGRVALFESHCTDLIDADNNFRWDAFTHDLSTGITARASVGTGGTEGNADSYAAALSDAGTRVAFTSLASNLVSGDANGHFDVFVHDFSSDTTQCASLTPSGATGDFDSGRVSHPKGTIDLGVSLSGDGRLVAFGSGATNLVPGDTNHAVDIFVRDLSLGTTRLVTVGPGGTPANQRSEACELSADGSLVVFHSWASNLVAGDANGRADVFLCELSTGAITRRTLGLNGAEPDFDCTEPTLSSDGRLIAFQSFASNLVLGDTNGHVDIFVHDALSNTMSRANLSFAGTQSFSDATRAHLSASGQFVMFTSAGPTLVQGDDNGVFDAIVRNCTSVFASSYCNGKVTSLGCLPEIGCTGTPSASGDGIFFVAAAPVLNAKTGVLMYGTNGRSALPFQGGTLCVAARVQRTPQVWSGGNPPSVNDCSGGLRLDMNAFARGALGGSPANALSVAGTVVDCQWWCVDPGHISTGKSAMSNALEYTVLP